MSVAGQPPMKLGKYSFVRRLAVGGMAELFLARASGAHGFEKIVVLKRILPSYVQNPAFTQMFLAEARLAALLVHPNIAQVFDFGEEAGTYFFTMEYVRGQNLRQIVGAARDQGKPLPLALVLHIIAGMLAGLHHAHCKQDDTGRALGIVHRDVSPANALVTYEGDVKLVDFGIAKVAALGPATAAGTLKGKVSYMSPEQCRAEPLDRRSDLFSIGTLLWELTVGRRLFGKSGGNELTTLRTVEEAVIPAPRSIRPNYPEALEAIVLKALQRDREDRYQDALEFRIALEDFAREERLPLSSAHATQVMTDLFPIEERRDLATSTGSFDPMPDEMLARPSDASAEHLTRPERSFEEPTVTPIHTRTMLAPQRRAVPVLAGIGVVALLSGGAYALMGGLRSSPEPPSGVPAPAEPSVAPAQIEPAPLVDNAGVDPGTVAPPPAPVPEAKPVPVEAAPAPRKTKKRRKKKVAPSEATPRAVDPTPAPKPASKPKTKKSDDIFMAPDPNRKRSKGTFF